MLFGHLIILSIFSFWLLIASYEKFFFYKSLLHNPSSHLQQQEKF